MVVIGLEGSVQLHVGSQPIRLENVLEHSNVL